jgi:FMN phosphatase YigB (HAD superfamily)
MPSKFQQTVAFDFDGVLHSYTSGWKGHDVIPDPPVTGMVHVLLRLRTEGYRIAIFSTRGKTKAGREAMAKWLTEHGFVFDEICETKPSAFVLVDDRCICFDGNPDGLIDRIKGFKPWGKR